MKFKAIAAAVMVAGMAATAVFAQDGTHEAREAMMKKIGGSVGAMTAIAKGEKPYDAEAVKAALTTISETAKAFPDQFKPGTEQGDKEASPKIWENMADFKARADKLSADADTILAQLPADQAGVGGALKTLGANCGGCHQAYRIKE
ncbi:MULTISPECIES: cytochrome c [unclassified Rhizobium]|jgi:cytochrome c556|uniref:c-type cytochrome n=1 Tax=unclassified Rhizobium TaxID=2613769 RepID=UPI000DD5E747|nr:cytochrome c [Rhizobium sp. BG4]QRM46771.1 cytochrome C556 [Rhizobium sp. BG4]